MQLCTSAHRSRRPRVGRVRGVEVEQLDEERDAPRAAHHVAVGRAGGHGQGDDYVCQITFETTWRTWRARCATSCRCPSSRGAPSGSWPPLFEHRHLGLDLLLASLHHLASPRPHWEGRGVRGTKTSTRLYLWTEEVKLITLAASSVLPRLTALPTLGKVGGPL